MDCNILSRNCHKESSITSRCSIFSSFYYPTNQFGLRNYKGNQMNPNITLIISLTKIWHQTTYLATQLAVQPTSCIFTCSLPLPKVPQRLRTAALPSCITLLNLSRYFFFSPGNSFLQFQPFAVAM
jgi:hypothetical protein